MAGLSARIAARRRVLTGLMVLALLGPAAGCSGNPVPVPVPVPLALGVAAEGISGYDTFRATAGAPVGIYEWYQQWEGAPPLDTARADAAVARGAVPLLTWEPWAAGGGADQPRYALARVAAGDFDPYIRSFARQVRDWGGVLGLRVFHEMNAPYYPWGVGRNGNTPADALAAWRHLRRLFGEEHADVLWVWCVNISGPDTVPYRPFYPGNGEVDWVGLDGYNGGTALPWGGWRTPEQLFRGDLDRLHDLSARPLVLSEVGSAEAGGDKATWIRDMFALARRSRVAALVWFDIAKETDWRVVSSPPAAAAFRAAADAAGVVAARPPLPSRLRPSPAASP